MTTWLDRTIAYVAPQWGLKRARARAAGQLLERHYEAAATSRRTSGWNRSAADANLVMGGALNNVRTVARDLVRNNAHAASAVRTIVDQVVGWGIVAKPEPSNQRVLEAWKGWAESTDCDADGRCDFYGLQKLILRTVVESGECLVRRRIRRPEDGLAIPLQLQVLEPDYIDTVKTMLRNVGRRIINGIEFDPIGRRSAYWLFPEHPGSPLYTGSFASEPVPAESILHVYRQDRPGQCRGMSWFAPVTVKLRDFDEYDDAQLLKQKIAAYLAVVISDPDGTGGTIGPGIDQSSEEPYVDHLKPGAIIQGPPGRTIETIQPPRVAEFADYASVTLRTIATGIGVAYEDLTGDYTNLPFSAARMSRLRQWARIEDWRWQMLIPQLCDPVWAWVMEAAQVAGLIGDVQPKAAWTAPPLPMIDPQAEGLAYQRNIRAGIMSLSEALRERGYDPEETLDELANDFEELDERGLVLDVDPRKMTQAGQAQAQPAAAKPAEAAAPAPEEPEGEDDEAEPPQPAKKLRVLR